MASTSGGTPSTAADPPADRGAEAEGPTDGADPGADRRGPCADRFGALLGGAKAAAGVAEEQSRASTSGALLDVVQARRDERFAKVLRLCSLVVSEQPVPPEQRAAFALRAGDVVDVLPPFAGGSHPA